MCHISAGRRYALRVFGRLFRRKREPADPRELAEKERLRREVGKARQRAEIDRARQRSEIEVHTPPPGGGFIP
jgi:hypothetical protein